MTDLDRVRKFQSLMHALIQKDVQGKHVSGRFSNQVDFNTYLDFMWQDVEFSDELEIESNAAELSISFFSPEFVYSSLEVFVNIRKQKLNPVSVPIYFLADDLVFDPNTPSSSRVGIINNLDEVIGLFKTLKEIFADYYFDDIANFILIFAGKEKLEVIGDYTMATIQNPVPGYQNFLREFVDIDDAHSEQRRQIFRDSVVGFFSGRGQINYGELVAEFGRVLEDSKDNLKLYLDNFGFDKIRDQIEAEKLEYVQKINKTLNDLNVQLMGLPVAVILVFKDISSGSPFVQVVATYVASVVYTLFLMIALQNQLNELKAIKENFSRQRQRLAQRQTAVREQFEDSYKEIDERCTHQYRVLVGICGFVVMVLLVTTWLYWFYLF